MTSSLRIRLGYISNFANTHIRSAISLTNRCFRIEKSFQEKRRGFQYDLHRACVTSALMLSSAFLEAAINELIIGVVIGVVPWNEGQIEGSKLETLEITGKIDGVQNMKTLEKYQLVLSVLGQKQFDSGKPPYQNVQLLMQLRNALVHFKPEGIMFVPENINEEHKLLVKLKNKFPQNPVAKSDNHLNYPDIILGHGCAKWAVLSSIDLYSEFSKRINLPRNYDTLKKDLLV